MERPAPKTLLDKMYYIGLAVKAFDGIFELIGSILLIVIPSATILSFAEYLTDATLHENPHSFIANHVLHVGTSLAEGSATFAIVFLFIHGFVKVGLVTCLLLGKPWAYPVGLSALSALTIYQIYELIVNPTMGMAFLTVLDIAVIWLVWREWKNVRAKAAPQASTTAQ